LKRLPRGWKKAASKFSILRLSISRYGAGTKRVGSIESSNLILIRLVVLFQNFSLPGAFDKAAATDSLPGFFSHAAKGGGLDDILGGELGGLGGDDGELEVVDEVEHLNTDEDFEAALKATGAFCEWF